jgi:tetratricopeptide (TPR) repeat protein
MFPSAGRGERTVGDRPAVTRLVDGMFLLLVLSLFALPLRDATAEHAGFVQQSQAGTTAVDEVLLDEQLRGLEPLPRIAYLRYLLRTKGEDPEVYFQLGVAFHESANPDSALWYYGKAARTDTQLSKAYVNMGVVYDEKGLQANALEMFEMAASINPSDVLAHAHAAFIRFLSPEPLGDDDKAWEHLSRALEIDPNHPQPHFYLAIFFWESRMYREALLEWERVIDIDPDGYLAGKARENIIILQKALNAPSGSGGWQPEM